MCGHACVGVRVCESEREKERECVCICVYLRVDVISRSKCVDS